VNEENMKKSSATKSNFGSRGWFLTIFAFFAFYMSTLLLNTMNLTVPAFSQTNGWDAAAMFSFQSVAGWIGVVVLFLTGWLAQKYSPKYLSLITLVLFGVAVIFWGHVLSLFQWVLILVLVQVLGNSFAFSGNAVLISNWFPRKKGLVIGWATIGLPFSAATGIALTNALMGGLGMKGAYYVFGGFAILLAIVGFFFLHDYPEDVGAYPDNDKTVSREQLKAEQQEGIERSKKSIWTTGRLFARKEIWMISISLGVQSMFAVGVMSQFIPRMLANKFTMDSAIIIVTVGGLAACVGSYLCGLADAKFGPRIAAIATYIFGILALVMGCFNNIVLLIVSIIIFGVLLGGSSNYPVSLLVTCFGRYDFARAYKICYPIISGIGTSGSIIVALVRFKVPGLEQNPYAAPYLIMAVLGVVGILLLLYIKEDFAKKYEVKFAAVNEAQAK
jgi:sugar phosphate permease